MNAEFDIGRTLRWLKPQRWTKSLTRRPDDKLPFLTVSKVVPTQLMLDTCVYLDTLQGQTPAPVDALIEVSTCNHSGMCLAELTHLFGRLDPTDARTPGALEQVKAMLQDIAPFRIHAPTTDVLGAAGVLAGMILRISHQADTAGSALIDACLYLQARKLGLTTITRNVRDFDLLN